MLADFVWRQLSLPALCVAMVLATGHVFADDGAPTTSEQRTCRSGLAESPSDPQESIARHDRALAACNALIDTGGLAGNELVMALLDRADLLAPGAGAAYKRALADYDRAITLAPKLAIAFWKRGKARLLYMRDLPRALMDLDTAIGLDPSQAEFFVTRASIQAPLAQPARALADLDHAIVLSPRFEKAWSVRGLTHFNNGDPNRAIADFDEAIRLAPYADDNYRFRAAARRAAGHEAGAVADETKAGELSASKAGGPALVTRP